MDIGSRRSGEAIRVEYQFGIAELPRFIPSEPIGQSERSALFVKREHDAVGHAVPQEEVLQTDARRCPTDRACFYVFRSGVGAGAGCGAGGTGVGTSVDGPLPGAMVIFSPLASSG